MESVPTLWASDGGLYGFYAQEILDGVKLPLDTEHMPAYLLAYLTYIFPLDRVLFFSPAFLASFVVFPLLLIGYAYNALRISFFAAIIGSISYAYYSRTHLGYYDTDTLNLFFSWNIIAFMILAVEKKDSRYIIGSVVFAMLFLFWYHSSKLIVSALFVNFMLYIIVLYRGYIVEKKAFFLTLLIILGIIFISFVDIQEFIIRANDYIFKAQNISFMQEDNKKLFFKSTLSSIGEAKALPLSQLGEYVSLNSVYLFFSTLGVILFVKKHTSFLLMLPLVLLSLLSMKGGIRFAEYGVFIFAFGTVYGIYVLKEILQFYKINRYLKEFVFFFLLFGTLFLSIKEMLQTNKNLHPIFTNETVTLLKNVNKGLHSKDYILTWWDYAWPLWYYTRASTLIDNGKHFEDNYIVSKLLFSSQEYTAKASRYFMEQCNEDRKCSLSKKLYLNKSPLEIDRVIEKSLKIHKSKEIYFFFHERMIEIMRVVLDFSDRDLYAKNSKRREVVKVLAIGSVKGDIYTAKENAISLDAKKRLLSIKGKKFSLSDVSIVNKHGVDFKKGYKNAKLHLIVYKNKYIIVCNDTIFNSFFVQAFVLNHYNKKYFERIGKTQEVKIFKVIK